MRCRIIVGSVQVFYNDDVIEYCSGMLPATIRAKPQCTDNEILRDASRRFPLSHGYNYDDCDQEFRDVVASDYFATLGFALSFGITEFQWFIDVQQCMNT